MARDHHGPCDLHLNKLGKGPLGNAIYQTLTPKPNGFEEEDFKYFMYFYGLNVGPLAWGHLDPGTFI